MNPAAMYTFKGLLYRNVPGLARVALLPAISLLLLASDTLRNAWAHWLVYLLMLVLGPGLQAISSGSKLEELAAT